MRYHPYVTCVGGAVLNRSYRVTGPVVLGKSHPATGGTAYGGVARNVAENLTRLGVRAALVSVVGDDVPGRALLDDLDRIGVDTWAVRPIAGRTTATSSTVRGPGDELVLGVSDTGVLDEMTPERVVEPLSRVETGAWIFADATLPDATHTRLASTRRTRDLRLAVDTVSVARAARVPADLGAVDVLFTNLDEARVLLVDRRRPPGETAHDAALALLDAGVRSVVLTLGAEGQVVADADGVTMLPAVPSAVLDVEGAGDALVGGTLADLVVGRPLREAVATGAAAAALATEVRPQVHPRLTRQLVDARRAAVPEGV
ncbi:PfkB family carbohydrate kinase [Nocardioides sp. ChNu-99]|uniref:PfkB family carbohydrate kinase n=1 Tax=Nocardioides sp. ChNu-99 TaxID=2839897 RepID=UPI002404C6E2|nr:PfkB family carbohydrate kinase [Nocardioides sp. ChNu-99]MDF9717292.1 hypothetical protein [Nocardioides sp. ChNu-99]